jgi:hypothetical protein
MGSKYQQVRANVAVYDIHVTNCNLWAGIGDSALEAIDQAQEAVMPASASNQTFPVPSFLYQIGMYAVPWWGCSCRRLRQGSLAAAHGAPKRVNCDVRLV